MAANGIRTHFPKKRMRTAINITKAHLFSVTTCAAVVLASPAALAVRSAELYRPTGHQYGRFEARMRFAFGDGVVSSFFLWKNRSEGSSTFWNELDFEKVRAECELETNALYGLPESTHTESHLLTEDLCGTYHTYTYEWTPEYIAWLIDDVEIRRETGDTAVAYAENTESGMQLRFNIWPGDASFGGNFDPAILPVHQYVNWAQYSSYADGAFQLEWREDFTATSRPSGWAVGSWPSPKNLSTHSTANVNFVDGYAVLSLTAEGATGFSGTVPVDTEDPGPVPTSTEPSSPAPTSGVPTGADPATAAATMPPPEDDRAGSGGCGMAVGTRSTMPWGVLAVALAVMGRRRSTREANRPPRTSVRWCRR
jgi:hypothetical protein